VHRARFVAAAIVVVVMATSLVFVTAPAAQAAAPDCTGAANTFTGNGGASGNYNDPTMWSAGTTPNNELACIPSGKTALIPNSMFFIGTNLRIVGTLKGSGDNVLLGGGTANIENFGRFESPTGTKVVFNTGGTITNRPGGVVSVDGGFIGLNLTFDNAGGNVDLPNSGTFNVAGSLHQFVQGLSADVTPVQGTVTSGKVQVLSGAALVPTGTGAGAFEWPPGSSGTLTGTLQPNQSIDLHCDGYSGTTLLITAGATNEGTIRFNPLTSGTTCTSDLNVAAGVTFTNSGSLTFGDPAGADSNFFLAGAGVIVNGPDGTLVVNQTVSSIGPRVSTDGQMTVNPTGHFNAGNNSQFELRDGTLTNNGLVGLFPANTYAIAGIFRVMLGDLVGHPIEAHGFRIELIGPGDVAIEVEPFTGNYLQNPSGPVLIRANQSFTINDGNLETVGPVENQGTVTLTGRGDGFPKFGTAGTDAVTNHGHLISTSFPNTGSGGVAAFAAPVVNEADGVVQVLPGRVCDLPGFTNKGLVDLGSSCIADGSASTLTSTSILRVHSSADELTGLFGVISGTTIAGTLDVVTDAGNPPSAGAPRDLVVGRTPNGSFFHTVLGSFDAITGGGPSPILGYALSYPFVGGGRRAQLQVIPLVTDLVVGDLTAPPTAAVGDDVTVSWTTTVGTTTSLPWTDSVFLSSSPNIDSSSVLLGRLNRTGTATAGDARPGSILVRVPAATDGLRYVVVVADSGLALPTNNRAAATGAKSITVGATPLAVGSGPASIVVGAEGTRTVGATTATLQGTRLLRLDGDADKDIVVTLSPANAVQAFEASGRLPSETDHDAAAFGGTMLVHGGDGTSSRFIVLRNTSASPVTVSVTATAPGVSIISTSPASALAGAPSPTAVSVLGTGFLPDSKAQLVCGATTINPVSTQVDDSTHLTSLFPLPTAVGTCDVKVGPAVRANAFNVTAPAVLVDPSSLKATIDVIAPGILRSNVDNRITVRWTNNTGYSLPAPLFAVSVDAGTIRFPGSPGNGVDVIDVLGIAPAGPAGILGPGASGSTELLVRGVAPHVNVSYFVAGIKAADPFEFSSALAGALGANVPQAAKDWVIANGPALLGVNPTITVAQFEAHLGDVASLLSGLGRRSPEVERLLAYDVARITDSGKLDSFAAGEFGNGQVGLDLPHITVETVTGDVLLVGQGRRFRYAKQANGTYLSPPATGDVLTPNANGFSLVSRDGLRRTYSTAGLLVTITDAALRVTTYGYSGNHLTSISGPLGTSSFGYDGNGRITSTTDQVGRVTTYGYDGAGHLTTTTTQGRSWASTWDAEGLPASSTGPDGVTTSAERDAFGRITTTRRNGTVTATIVYNPDGSISATDAVGRTIRLWVDDMGGAAKEVDALGRINTARRDAQGAIIGALIDGVPTGSLLVTNPARALSGVVDGAGNTTLVNLGVNGLVQSVTDPDGRTTSIGRNANSDPSAVTDPAGATSTITYDNLGRPSVVTDRSGRKATTTYGANDLPSQVDIQGGGTITMTYDAHRNVKTATGPTGTTTYTYDANDRLTGIAYPNGLGLTYGYDSAGRRTSTTTSDGQANTATYDARGRLATVSSNGTVVTRYEYDAADRLNAMADANGSRTEVVRDNGGRIQQQKTTCCTADGAAPGATVISDVQLTYDLRDRVATRVDEAGVTTYGYDGASRLVSAVTVGASPRTITYTYDRNGNRLAVHDSLSGDVSTTLGPAGRPAQIGTEAVSHDAEGRETARGTSTYTWDARGSLATASVGGVTTSYEYDAFKTPISRTTGGVTTKLLADPNGRGFLVGEYTSAGQLESSYVWGQGLAGRTDSTGALTSYYASDPRGDVVALTDSGGAVTDSYRYLPFGEVADHTGATTQPFGFQGTWGLRTEPTGLVNARDREYDPAIGRFLSEDSVLFGASNPATWASSDPINRTDINGMTDGPLFQVNGDPVSYGASMFGIDTHGNAAMNFAQGVGLADTAVSGAGLVSQIQRNARLTQGAKELYQDANALMETASPAGTLFRTAKSAQLNRKVAETLLKSRTPLPSVGKGGGVNPLGLALNGFQAAANISEWWNAPENAGEDAFDTGAYIVRQSATAFLKTVSGKILPGSDLVWDPLFNIIDLGSMDLFQRANGVDPEMEPYDTHWRPKNDPRRKKGESGSGDSSDPNAIIGPVGVTVGADRFVSVLDELPYTIQFENQPAATLPANEILVTQTLDPDLDLATFELGEISIGNASWVAPSGQHTWTTVLDDQGQSGLLIKLNAKLDLGTRVVTWKLTGIDPVTGDVPADATKGFLPPDVNAPEGRGFVTYVVRATGSSPTGTAVVGQATIVFDANAPIDTNVDTVVIDADAPTGTPSVPSLSSNPVSVALNATDGAGGSGLDTVDVLASQDGAPFTVVGDHVTGNSFEFNGTPDSHYLFRIVPTDKVGNAGDLSAASGDLLVAADGQVSNPTITLGAPSTADVGDTIHGAATLAGGNSPTGTISFSVYAPDNTTCSGLPFATGNVPVSGNGDYQSADVVPDVAGTYRWLATYSGDNNNTQDATLCDAANTVVVAAPAGPSVALDVETTPDTRPAPGGIFAYLVTVTNTSAAPATITSLTDTHYGDLASRGSCVNAIGTVLAASDQYMCQFAVTFNGVEGDALGTTTQVTVEDETGAPASDSAPTAIALSAPAAVGGGSQGGGPTTTGGALVRTGSDVMTLVEIGLTAIGIGLILLLRRRQLMRG
jgi:RHS repeat-associated protein